MKFVVDGKKDNNNKNAYRPNTYTPIHAHEHTQRSNEGNMLRKSNHEWQVTTAAAESQSYITQRHKIQHPVKRNRNNNNYGCNYNSCMYMSHIEASCSRLPLFSLLYTLTLLSQLHCFIVVVVQWLFPSRSCARSTEHSWFLVVDFNDISSPHMHI